MSHTLVFNDANDVVATIGTEAGWLHLKVGGNDRYVKLYSSKT